VRSAAATKEEGQRIAQLARQQNADAVAGIGGGKLIDIAKAVAWDAGIKLMTVPTIAATDAPTSAATVWYDAESNFTGFECWPGNPDLVLVDTQVIAGGPPRALAGMGDACPRVGGAVQNAPPASPAACPQARWRSPSWATTS
jgi:glycerol dehydrogenase